jgi:hypothetical protein
VWAQRCMPPSQINELGRSHAPAVAMLDEAQMNEFSNDPPLRAG